MITRRVYSARNLRLCTVYTAINTRARLPAARELLDPSARPVQFNGHKLGHDCNRVATYVTASTAALGARTERMFANRSPNARPPVPWPPCVT